MEHHHLVLTGLSGAGKSTVGQLLASTSDRRFCDLDRQLEVASELSISEMFDTWGEEGFRRREFALLKSILDGEPTVIAAGGGALVTDISRQMVRTNGLLVWLRVTPGIAAQRVSRSESRPLLQGNTQNALEQLLELRRLSYADCDFSVDTDERSPEEAVGCILEWLAGRS